MVLLAQNSFAIRSNRGLSEVEHRCVPMVLVLAGDDFGGLPFCILVEAEVLGAAIAIRNRILRRDALPCIGFF